MSNSSMEAQQFAAALQESYPRMWSGATMQTFPIEKYLAFADEASDDGGPVAVALPRSSASNETTSVKAGPIEVFDGAEDLQQMVSYPLSKFLAIVAKRSANNSNSDDSRSSSSSSSSSGHSNSTHDGSLYGCQIPLAGSGAPSLASGGCGNGALRQALAAGARACVPEWAAVALAAADAAIEATAASATTTRGNGDDDDECDDEESEAGADSSSSSGALSSINAWLCAGLTESESSSGTAAMMRTEAHFDGYHNLMCVLEGRKVVELWPPGTPNLTRRAPAWVHHVPPPPPKEGRLAGESTGSSLCTFTGAASTMAVELPPAPEVLVLNGGDVGFWPEGWWHRVTSLPATRAVNVWWSGARPFLAQTLPSAEVPYALRLLAHRAAELRIAEWTEEQRKADAKAYRAEKAAIPKGYAWKLPSDAECSHPRRYPMLCLPDEIVSSSSLDEQSDEDGSSARKRARVNVSRNNPDVSRGQNRGDDDADDSNMSHNDPAAMEVAENEAWCALLQDWAFATQSSSTSEDAATLLARLQRVLRLSSVTPSALRTAAHRTAASATSNGGGNTSDSSSASSKLQPCMAWAKLIMEGIDDLTAHVSAEQWAQQDRHIQQDREEAVSAAASDGNTSSSTRVGTSSSSCPSMPLEDALFCLPLGEAVPENGAAIAALAEAKRVFILKKERLARSALSSAVEDFTGIAAPPPY